MLVLTRRPGERIRVGTTITMTVLEVQGRRVRIGIDAPANVRVLRDEAFAERVGPQTVHKGQVGETSSCI